MVRIISVKCPECGAALQFEEGRQIAYCSYCGTKILLHNENEHIYRSVDEAGIKQAENQRLYIMKELELKEKEEKHQRMLTYLWIILTIALIVIGSIMVSTGPKDSDDPGHLLILLGMGAGMWGWLMRSDGKK